MTEWNRKDGSRTLTVRAAVGVFYVPCHPYDGQGREKREVLKAEMGKAIPYNREGGAEAVQLAWISWKTLCKDRNFS